MTLSLIACSEESNDNDGKAFSFEYKMIEDEGSFGVAFIGKEWGKDYYGYFFFNKGGYVEDYADVTVTAQDNGFMKVDFDLTAVDCITGDQKPEKVESLYVRLDNNEANFIIRLAE